MTIVPIRYVEDRKQYLPGNEPDHTERMFVCSLVNAAIGTGKLPLKTDELVAAIKATRTAWSTTFGAG
jgi:hypothetical protein